MKSIITCDQKVWNEAQKFEKRYWRGHSGEDDWNVWHMKVFDDYTFLSDYNIKNVCEVGCGPHAKNLKLVLEQLGNDPDSITLEDPLLDSYLNSKNTIKNLNANLYSMPLEELESELELDLIVCINVLSHVYDADKCMSNMFRMLSDGGILILAQDLCNDEDMSHKWIKEDIGHPVKLDMPFFEPHIEKYSKTLFSKNLKREECRSPRDHYSELIYAGMK